MALAAFDRARCRHERLTEHLPAEDLRTAYVAALAAKQVHLELLQLQKVQ